MIRRLLLGGFFAVLASCAIAQTVSQCPGSAASWSATLPPPMQFMIYDMVPPQGVPGGLLYILYLNHQAEAFLGVPQAVATSFRYSSNQPLFFANQIQHVYHELLLFETSNCALLLKPTGALWTR